MANNCYFEMLIKGTKESCEEWVKRMCSHNEPNHFYRIFTCEVYESEYIDEAKNEYMMEICGDCAWSLESCCRASGYSNGIDLFAVNTKELNLRMEVFSEETGMCFQEHYIYDRGICKADECVDYHEYWYTESEYGSFEEYKKIYKIPDEITEEDFDENGICKVGGFDEWEYSI